MEAFPGSQMCCGLKSHNIYFCCHLKKKTSQGKKPDPMLFENRKCCANAKSSIIIVTPSNSVLNNLNLLNQTDAICAVLKPRLVICFMQKKKAYHMKIAESPQK